MSFYPLREIVAKTNEVGLFEMTNCFVLECGHVISVAAPSIRKGKYLNRARYARCAECAQDRS